MRLQIDRKLLIAIASTSIIVTAVAAIAVTSTGRFRRDAHEVSRTHEVRVALRELLRGIDAAEGDVRGYLLTGDSAYLLSIARTSSQATPPFYARQV